MRLIDADALMDSHVVTTSNKDVIMRKITLHEISEAPTIEAEPVVHAHWIKANYGRIAQCSHCSDLLDVTDSDSIETSEQAFKNFCSLYIYCPTCGAKMFREESK